MKKILLQFMALTTLCWIMASCSDDTFNQKYGEGIGCLHLTLGKVDVELTSTTRAEAGTLPEDLIPKAEDFMIDIQMGNESVEGFPKKYSELTAEGIELKVGGYTVTAYCGENELIQATPYFSTSVQVQILPGKPTKATLNAALANAMLTPAVSESLQNHYKEWALTIKVGNASETLANNEKINDYLFVQAGQPVDAVFEGTNILGKETSHEWTVVSSAVSQKKYVIQCDPDLSVFSNIQLTATATHTYADGSLTGTDVILNLDANGAPLKLVEEWDIQLLYNGTPIRTYVDQPESDAIMTVTEGWPYVPQDCTLFAYIRLQTGETIELSTALEEIPQPEFTVTVSGNTSYSVYQSSGADAANTKDGSSIFDIASTTTIAPEISDNPNYSDILKVTYTTDSGQTSGELPFGIVTQLNSLAWQKHALTATVSFDGVENTSSPVDCHVTGLPYTLKHPANNYGWYQIGGTNVAFNNDYIYLETSTTWNRPIVGSPSFYIPETLEFSLYCQYQKNTKSTFSSYTFYVEKLKPEDKSRPGVICSHSEKNKGIYDLSGSDSFTSEINAVSCRYDYGALGNSVNVISIQINYR